MKIALAVRNSKGKTILYVTDDLKVLVPAEAVILAKNSSLEGIYVAKRGTDEYLRAKKSSSVPKIDSITISVKQVITAAATDLLISPQVRLFYEMYRLYLQNEAAKGRGIITVESKQFATVEHIQEKLREHRTYIFAASSHFTIDPILLAAILIDEVARLSSFEDIIEKLASEKVNYDASVGIAQVKLSVARGLIGKDYYNPDPTDAHFDQKNAARITFRYLYQYVADPKHNIYFAAANIRSIVDHWKSAGIDITPDIIATLYSLGDKPPHPDPQPNARGSQITIEFYSLARDILTAS